jgi:hypothetical protein
MINEDIDEIIQRGEQRTAELSNRYEGLSFEDLSNFKSEASVQQWEGEDFRAVCNSRCLEDNSAFVDTCVAKTTQLQPAFHAKTRTEDELLG